MNKGRAGQAEKRKSVKAAQEKESKKLKGNPDSDKENVPKQKLKGKPDSEKENVPKQKIKGKPASEKEKVPKQKMTEQVLCYKFCIRPMY